MKTMSYKIPEALKDVWRWREALTVGTTDESVEEKLRAIARRGDEAARRFGYDGGAQTAGRVAEAGATYGAGTAGETKIG
jgi:hypothetical protein